MGSKTLLIHLLFVKYFIKYLTCFICDSEKVNTDRRSQLLALGVLCKLLQRIQSFDTVNFNGISDGFLIVVVSVE